MIARTMSWQRPAAIFVLAAACTYGALTPALASAAWVKQHASACQVEAGTIVAGYEAKYSLYTNDNRIDAVCSFPETSTLTKSTIADVFVTGGRVENPNSFDDKAYGKACRSFSSSDSGECGSASSTTATGNIDLQVVDVSKWNNNTGFAYVFASFTGWGQDIRGVYFGE